MVQSSNLLRQIPIYLIYHREDRKLASEENFRDTGIEPIYIKGFDAKKLFGNWPLPHRSGTIGCYLSFLSAFNIALRENHEYVIIGEDDMYFADNFSENFEKMFNSLPEDWESVFLGHYKFDDNYTRINESVIKIPHFHGHHAVLYKREVLGKILANIENLIDDALDLKIIDMQNHGVLNLYVADPQICKAKSNHTEQIFTSTTDGKNETDTEYILRMEIHKKMKL
jgi:GR25 family glycosyltransferase involved in LPS biosynthesis